MRRARRVRDALRGRVLQIRWVLRRSAVERELAEELAHHVELETEANLRRGLDPVAARRAALVAFGGVERYAEQVSEARWTRWVEDVVQDARYAARGLMRSRAFALAAMVTLSLGIGANSALYGVLHGLLDRMPAGVPPSDRLVRVENEGRFERWSHPDFRDVAAGAAGAVELAAWLGAPVSLVGGGEPVRVNAQLVSSSYFEVLGLRPERGRFFVGAEDEVPGRDAVVVLGHRLWQEWWEGRDDVIGAGVVISGHPFTVVGVAPAGFGGLDVEDRAQLWLPLMAQPLGLPRTYDVLGSHAVPQVDVIGRLAAGVSPEAATEALRVAAARLPEAKRWEPVAPRATPLRGWLELRALASGAPIIAFAGILTGLVLLICCANVANLQLGRALGRSREIAVRLALGAGRGRLIRLLLTEALLLAACAGVLGVLVAFWMARWIQLRFAGPLAALEVDPDAGTMAFTLAIALISGTLFGLAPALRAARPEILPTIRGGGDAGRRRGRLRGVLVAAQVALSLVLLTASGLFLGRLRELGRIDPGFDAARVVAFSVDLHAHGYAEADRARFMDELRDRLERLPGVAAAAAPTAAPLGAGSALVAVSLPDAAEPAAGELDAPQVTITRTRHAAAPQRTTRAVAAGVSPDFFRVLEVDVERGRTLLPADMESGAPRVTIISPQLAQRLWPGADPIGRSLLIGDAPAQVVGTLREPLPLGHMAEPEPLQVYLPHQHHFQFAEQTVLLRTSGDPAQLQPLLREQVRALDPALPVFDMHTLAERIDEQLRTQRALTRLVGMFGGVALLLALVGLYGVVSSAVVAATHDVGVRIALGARAHQVTRLFVGQGVRLALMGVVTGALLALAVGRLISSIVWGVRPWDAAALTLSASCLLLAAAAASWLPARRAARVDPMRILRAD